MIKTMHATFDGTVLRPEEPLELPPNTRVLITVSAPDKAGATDVSFLKTAEALNLGGPADWSERADEYLYHPGFRALLKE
jgi:hypothetical protein